MIAVDDATPILTVCWSQTSTQAILANTITRLTEFGPPENRSASDVACVLSTFRLIGTMRFAYHAAGPNSNGTVATVMLVRDARKPSTSGG